MKRVFCVCAALIVAVTPAFAWNAESFVSDGMDTYQYYETASVVDEPMLYSSQPMMFSAGTYAASSGTATSADFVSFFENFTYSYHKGYSLLNYIQPGISSGGIILPDIYVYQSYPESGVNVNLYQNSSSAYELGYRYNVIVPSSYDDYDIEDVMFPWFQSWSGGDYTNVSSAVLAGVRPKPDFIIDLSKYGSFNAFSFDGVIRVQELLADLPNYSNRSYLSAISLEMYVNDALVHTFYADPLGYVDFGSSIFSFSSDVTSLYFKAFFDGYHHVSAGQNYIYYFIVNGSDSFKFSVLSDTSVIDGFNDEAQNNINEHEALESQWTGSMTSNFNALNLDDFTIPDGLVSGFALISGIFNDLWNGMGEFKIVYVFPLTLGVVLLLIGRISKFSGGHGSAKRGRSDDNA